MALDALLAEQPADPQPPLPVLPPPGGVNDVAVQVAYLDVPGLDATGVRWVGRFSQDLSPVMNYQLRYLFQGLTADGQTLISASYPDHHDAAAGQHRDHDRGRDGGLRRRSAGLFWRRRPRP